MCNMCPVNIKRYGQEQPDARKADKERYERVNAKRKYS